MNEEQRLQDLESVLDGIRRAAMGAAVVVEGKRDVRALEELGIGGQHLMIHTGQALEARIDAIAEAAEVEDWPRLIILADWDRTGGRLAKRLEVGLAARVHLDLDWRRRLALVTLAKCLEHVPGDLAGLRRRVKGP